MRLLPILLILTGVLGLIVGLMLYGVFGTVNTPTTIALLIGIAALLAVSYLRFQEIAQSLQGREFVYGSGTLLSVVVVAIILVFAYLFLQRYNKRFDWSGSGKFTLASQTEKVLQTLPRPIHVVAIDRESEGAADTRRVLELFQYAGGRNFSYELIDDQRDRGRLLRYQTYLVGYERPPVLLVTQETDAAGLRVEKVTTREEQDITNAIIKLAKQTQRKVYFTEGHGERKLEGEQGGGEADATAMSMVKKALELQGYVVATVSPIEREQLPDDCDLLVIAGPQTDFYPHELRAVDAMLATGRDLLLLVDPQMCPNLVAWANRRFGLLMGDDIVVEYNPLLQMLGGDPTQPIVNDFNEAHDITRTLRKQNIRIVVPLSRSVRVAEERPAGVLEADWLLRSSEENSWAETDWVLLREGKAVKDAADFPGPVPLGAAIVMEATAVVSGATEDTTVQSVRPQARVAVYGSSSIIIDSAFSAQGTGALISNTINWLSEQQDLIAIPPKDRKDTSLVLSQAQLLSVVFVCMIGTPLAFLIAGVTVIVLRRMSA